MNNMYVIDSNAVLRYLLKDNLAQSEEVEKVLKKVKEVGGRIFVPREVVMECVYTLIRFYKVDRKDIYSSLKLFFNASEVVLEERELIMKTLEYFLVVNISYVDCFVLVQTKQLGGELLTFDKKLVAAARRK